MQSIATRLSRGILCAVCLALVSSIIYLARPALLRAFGEAMSRIEWPGLCLLVLTAACLIAIFIRPRLARSIAVVLFISLMVSSIAFNLRWFTRYNDQRSFTLAPHSGHSMGDFLLRSGDQTLRTRESLYHFLYEKYPGREIRFRNTDLDADLLKYLSRLTVVKDAAFNEVLTPSEADRLRRLPAIKAEFDTAGYSLIIAPTPPQDPLYVFTFKDELFIVPYTLSPLGTSNP